MVAAYYIVLTKNRTGVVIAVCRLDYFALFPLARVLAPVHQPELD